MLSEPDAKRQVCAEGDEACDLSFYPVIYPKVKCICTLANTAVHSEEADSVAAYVTSRGARCVLRVRNFEAVLCGTGPLRLAGHYDDRRKRTAAVLDRTSGPRIVSPWCKTWSIDSMYDLYGILMPVRVPRPSSRAE